MAMGNDPNAAAAKWQRNYTGSAQSAIEGVNRVTTAPGQAAAAQRQVWVQRLTDPATQDKWARKVAAVSLSQWQEAYRQKAPQRMATGATTGMPKMQNFLQKFLPHVQAGVAALPPRGDIEANLQRANQMARHNATFKG